MSIKIMQSIKIVEWASVLRAIERKNQKGPLQHLVCIPQFCTTFVFKISPGARFSKVPIINGPGKLSPFTLKTEVSTVLHLTR